jgi:hypothetical protein
VYFADSTALNRFCKPTRHRNEVGETEGVGWRAIAEEVGVVQSPINASVSDRISADADFRSPPHLASTTAFGNFRKRPRARRRLFLILPVFASDAVHQEPTPLIGVPRGNEALRRFDLPWARQHLSCVGSRFPSRYSGGRNA